MNLSVSTKHNLENFIEVSVVLQEPAYIATRDESISHIDGEQPNSTFRTELHEEPICLIFLFRFVFGANE